MLRRYSVGVRGAAPTGNLRPHSALWNPSSDVNLWVVSVDCTDMDSVAGHIILCRITTQGTAASTVTPDADNDWDREVAPKSGAVIGLADFSVLPTVGGDLDRYVCTAAGGGMQGLYGAVGKRFARPILVPPGTGLSLSVHSGQAITDDTWTWEE